ncbi:MAG: N-acetylglucosamine-6-phosphate deacetylase, partial [Acidimicrobiales bacterium]
EVIRRPPPGTRVLGAHLEGPFLNPERRGAHPQPWLRRPDPVLARELLGLTPLSMSAAARTGPGVVAVLTLAPELDGAHAVLSLAREAGVVVSLGHSAATTEQAHAAFDAGATMVTHLWNAQSPVTARAAGLTGVALARPGVFAGLIADLAHVHADTLRFSLAALGGRAFVVSDAVALAGSTMAARLRPDGRREHIEGTAVRFDDGSLAGSATGLDQALRNLVALGLSLPAALATITRTPALALGRRDLGRLSPGGEADVVVLNEDLTIASVLVAGVAVDV